MGKYISLLRYELKTILRDPMSLFMCCFPLLVLALSAFVFPSVFGSMAADEQGMLQIVMLIMLIVILTFGSYFISAMATFLMLDHKDECTLNTIAVTPIGASGYLRFKMAYVYVLSVIATLIVFFGTKYIAGEHYSIGGVSLFDNVGVIKIVAFSLVSSLFVPALTLFQSAFARNKVEGFAYIKGTGLVLFIPILMLLDVMQGGWQYALGVFPNFWAAKGMLLELFPMPNAANLSFPLYLAIGAALNLLVIVAAYRLFLKKTQY